MKKQGSAESKLTLYERASMLETIGYRGFAVTRRERYADGVTITAERKGGARLMASGSTDAEALRGIIGQADRLEKEDGNG